MKTWTIAYRAHAVRADETVEAEFWSLGKEWFYFIVNNVPVKAVYHGDVLSVTLTHETEPERVDIYHADETEPETVNLSY